METPISPPAKICETIQIVEKIVLDQKSMPIVGFPQHGDKLPNINLIRMRGYNVLASQKT
jgi:hypothetical protein